MLRAKTYPFTGVPVITAQPTSKNVALGNNITLECLAIGQGPMQFTWETYNDISGWHAIDIDNTTSYTVSTRTDGKFMYRCKVTNKAGLVTSDVANIIVFGKWFNIQTDNVC